MIVNWDSPAANTIDFDFNIFPLGFMDVHPPIGCDDFFGSVILYQN
jgi:hypothetical protein